jgi:hypothetical protein
MEAACLSVNVGIYLRVTRRHIPQDSVICIAVNTSNLTDIFVLKIFKFGRMFGQDERNVKLVISAKIWVGRQKGKMIGEHKGKVSAGR